MLLFVYKQLQLFICFPPLFVCQQAQALIFCPSLVYKQLICRDLCHLLTYRQNAALFLIHVAAGHHLENVMIEIVEERIYLVQRGLPQLALHVEHQLLGGLHARLRRAGLEPRHEVLHRRRRHFPCYLHTTVRLREIIKKNLAFT